jgi:hypothetical protein
MPLQTPVATYFTPSNFCLFSPFSRDLFHDSSTADPYDPPISNGNGANGDGDNGDNPPPVVPPEETPKITSVTLTGVVTAYSQEGKAPVLTGLTVNVIYDNAGPEVPIDLGTAAGRALFGTTPAILGEGEINTVTPQVAAPVWINVYPKSNEGRTFSVQIPGVQALKITSRGASLDYAATSPANNPIGVAGAAPADFKNFLNTASTPGHVGFGGTIIYQDEFKAAPAVGGTIYAQYEVLYKAGVDPSKNSTQSIDLDDPDEVATYPIAQNEALAEIGGTDWDPIALNEDYLFIDYYERFSTGPLGGSGANARARLPYGIDLDNQEIAFLISRGTAGNHGDTGNRSVYITVPFSRTTFHYVRGIDITGWANLSGTDVEGKPYSGFFTQAELVSINPDGVARWNTFLDGKQMNFTVYYDNPTSPGNVSTNEIKNRDYTYFKKAIDLGVGGVQNYRTTPSTPSPVVGISDDDNFGKVTIGYYTSLASNGSPDPIRNPVTVGDQGGFQVYDMPIAVYQEGSARMALRPNAIHPNGTQDGKIPLVVDNNPSTPRTAGARITTPQYNAIINSYRLVGDFVYQGNTYVFEMIPSGQMSPLWFSGLSTTEVDENYEVTVTVRGATLNALTPPRPSMALLYNGQEATFNVKLYPAQYDTTANP